MQPVPDVPNVHNKAQRKSKLTGTDNKVMSAKQMEISQLQAVLTLVLAEKLQTVFRNQASQGARRKAPAFFISAYNFIYQPNTI